MMKPKIKIVEVEEDELEDYLVKNPDVIEERMKILGHQVRTDSGPLDILAVDQNEVLVVIELKAKIDDGQLDQGLRYYDWVRSNIEWISLSFSGKKGVKIDTKEEPGLMLIAPGFSESLKRIAKYVSIPIDFMEYTAIELFNGEKHIICKNVELGEPPEPAVVPTREGHLNCIEDEEVRELCRSSLRHLEALGIEVRPIKGKYFSLWFRKKRFMHLGCKRKYFTCRIERSEGVWTDRLRVEKREDWEEILNNEVFPVYKKLGGRQERLLKIDSSN